MFDFVNDSPTRRQVLHGGLFAAAAAMLAGCQQATHITKDLPGPLWPDREPVTPGPLPPIASRQTAPALANPDRYVSNGAIAAPPGIIPRSRWAKGEIIKSRVDMMRGVSRITIHHEGNTFYGASDINAIARRLENIRIGHTNRKPEKFGDIGYHYIIDPVGRIWEGRNVYYQGAHVEAQNPHNLGIMVMGNFMEQRPTSAQLNALEHFVTDRMRSYRIPVGRVYTHREIGQSVCPGTYLQKWMDGQRSPAGIFARV